jgi:hypothetical protein
MMTVREYGQKQRATRAVAVIAAALER